MPFGSSNSDSDRGHRRQRHSPSDDRKPPAPRDNDDDDLNTPALKYSNGDDSDGAPDAGTERSSQRLVYAASTSSEVRSCNKYLSSVTFSS